MTCSGESSEAVENAWSERFIEMVADNISRLSDNAQQAEFRKFLADQGRNIFPIAKAAMGEDGSVLVPQSWLEEAFTGAAGSLMGSVRKIILTGGDEFIVPRFKTADDKYVTDVRAVWANELAIEADELALAQTASSRCKTWELIARGAISLSLLEDIREPHFHRVLENSLTEAIDNAVATGQGANSAQPDGLTNITADHSFKQVQAASAGAVSTADLKKAYFALRHRYRRNASWVMSSETLELISDLVVGQEPVWHPDSPLSPSGAILGRPVVLNDTIAKGTIAFADLRAAYWLIVSSQVGVRFIDQPTYTRNYGYLVFRAKAGGMIVDPNAGVIMNGTLTLTPKP